MVIPTQLSYSGTHLSYLTSWQARLLLKAKVVSSTLKVLGLLRWLALLAIHALAISSLRGFERACGIVGTLVLTCGRCLSLCSRWASFFDSLGVACAGSLVS